MAPDATATRTDVAWVLTKREQQPDWGLRDAATIGFVRAKCNGMEGTWFNAGVVLAPFGQSAPVHALDAELIFYQLDGEVEFDVDGERFPLEKDDLLFVPADAPYSYANTGRETAAFISIIGRVDAWPPTSTYYAERPAPRKRPKEAARTDRPWVLTRRDQQPAWTLPRADTVGFVRGWYTRVEATQFGAGIATIEGGQATPLHSSAAEHIIYLLSGEVVFTIEDVRHAIFSGDMLFIPADAKYVYANVGRTQAAFVSVISRVREWPHEDTYYE